MKVRFTPSAREQFLAAIRYVLADSPQAAATFERKCSRSLRRLLRFPESGRRLPEFPELPFREVLVNPYRFFYTVRGATVWVVAVWHGAQPPQEPGE